MGNNTAESITHSRVIEENMRNEAPPPLHSVKIMFVDFSGLREAPAF